MTTINCRACHKIHTNFESTDWVLSTVSKVPCYVKPTDTIANMGKGNLCVNCHQALSINPVDTATGDSIKVTNRFGSHYGPQVSVLIGRGGCESILDTGGRPTTIPAAVLTNGCIQCHVNVLDGKNHTFKPSKAVVTAAILSIGNIDTVKAAVNTLMLELRDTLVVRKILKKDSSAVIGVSLVPGAAGRSESKKVAGACCNYLMAAEDESRGIHNFLYVKWLLEKSLAALKE